ncbi:hypothetical protein BX616_003469, partial [Lobosporangium transversale]
LQLQSFLTSTAVQQHQQQQQQQQLQAQHEQQQLLLNTQAQLAAFRWALAQTAFNNNSNNLNPTPSNLVTAAATAATTVTSPPDSIAFFGSPNMISSSLSPQSDTLMLPTSPSAFSSENDPMLSPTLLSSQTTAVATAATTTTTTPMQNSTTKTEKTKTAKRQSMDDGVDADAKTTASGNAKRSKKTSSTTKGTAPSVPKKPRTKKTSKVGSDQSDMEMSVSSSASVASTTPSPQTLALQLPTSATAGASGATSLSTSTGGLFQALPLMPITPTSIATTSSPGVIPFWKMAPGMVLPPTMPLSATGFDPNSFAGAIMPGIDASTAPVTSTTTTQQISATSQPGQPQPVQQKVPITRLKPPQALVTPVPTPTTAQGNQPTKQQKKVAHNAIERRYRNNINDRINDLKNVVPALCNVKTKDEKDDDDDEEPEDADGVTRATKLNKATILRKATEYIVVLQKREAATKAENAVLRKLLTSLPGGMDLLEQHQANEASAKDENPIATEFSSEESISEPTTPPPTSTTSPGATRVLMAFFMCATLFTSPEGNAGVNRVMMDDGQGAGRVMSSSSQVFGQSTSAQTSVSSNIWSPFNVVTWDAWAFLRTFVFMGCLLALVWPSYSRRGPFAQSKFPVMPKSSSPAHVYTTLSGLVPKTIHSSYVRLFFALSQELWRCLWIRLGFYPDLTDMVRPDIWARVVEVQMSGGAGVSVSRFMLLYTIVRTLDEYTNARRQPPARVSATAALAFYISLHKAAKPLATLVAQQFMESARWTAKISGIGQDRWLESMLQVEVGSTAWNRSIIEIESTMYGHGEYPQTEAILFQTMAPTLVVAQTQSVNILQDAYVACMSRLNASIDGQADGAMQQHQEISLGRRVAKFEDAVRATLPGTHHHWYALVGKISELWLAKDEQSAQLGDRLLSQVMAMHPRHHSFTQTNSKHHHHHHESELALESELVESSFQYYDQMIVYSLLEYAYLRRGMAGPSVRCGEKALALMNERRRATGSKASLATAHHPIVFPSGTDGYGDDKALLGVACFAMNLTGFVQIKARIGLWRGVEALSTLIKRSRQSVPRNGEEDDMSQTEILDHIRTTLLPLTVHLRRQLDDESTTMLSMMQFASSSTRNKVVRRPTIDFDPALRFLIDIGCVAYGAWEDGSDGSDSGCGSGGEEEEKYREDMMSPTTSSFKQKAGLFTKKTDAEKAWELCQGL